MFAVRFLMKGIHDPELTAIKFPRQKGDTGIDVQFKEPNQCSYQEFESYFGQFSKDGPAKEQYAREYTTFKSWMTWSPRVMKSTLNFHHIDITFFDFSRTKITYYILLSTLAAGVLMTSLGAVMAVRTFKPLQLKISTGLLALFINIGFAYRYHQLWKALPLLGNIFRNDQMSNVQEIGAAAWKVRRGFYDMFTNKEGDPNEPLIRVKQLEASSESLIEFFRDAVYVSPAEKDMGALIMLMSLTSKQHDQHKQRAISIFAAQINDAVSEEARTVKKHLTETLLVSWGEELFKELLTRIKSYAFKSNTKQKCISELEKMKADYSNVGSRLNKLQCETRLALLGGDGNSLQNYLRDLQNPGKDASLSEEKNGDVSRIFADIFLKQISQILKTNGIAPKNIGEDHEFFKRMAPYSDYNGFVKIYNTVLQDKN